MNIKAIFFAAILFFLISNAMAQSQQSEHICREDTMKTQKKYTEKEWKEYLDMEQYRVLRGKGTEMPFSGRYNLFYEEGVYKCAACGQALFSSESKYNSGSGWPSFFAPLNEESILKKRDTSHGMIRTEILCSSCGGHLGHVFDDGPGPEGKRYCVNSVSLDFEKSPESDEKDQGKDSND